MEHFIEGVMELLFSFIKTKPDQMPELEHKTNFVVQYNKTVRIVVLVLLSILLFAVLFLYACAVGDLKVILAILAVSDFILLIINGFLLLTKYDVTTEKIKRTVFYTFKKDIGWDDIICIRIIEKTDEESVTIALYNRERKCVVDISSKMENAWQIVKIAEQKSIDIRQEKDLSIKQMRRL